LVERKVSNSVEYLAGNLAVMLGNLTVVDLVELMAENSAESLVD
jgi:hypothetical protein